MYNNVESWLIIVDMGLIYQVDMGVSINGVPQNG